MALRVAALAPQLGLLALLLAGLAAILAEFAALFDDAGTRRVCRRDRRRRRSPARHDGRRAPSWDALHEQDAGLSQIEAESGGRLCFAYRDLQTRETLRYRADLRCKTASVIKLPILVHVALAVREGSLSWNDKLTLTDKEKVGGSGVLSHLQAGLSLKLRDACVLMTIVSENTATNMILERLGIAPINARMRQLGLPLTTLYRKIEEYHISVEA